MYTSLTLMEATGVSRATLNNYITMGLIPRPVIKKPDAQSKSQARQIGYFPPETLSRIQQIQQLKKDGKSMTEIASLLRSQVSGSNTSAESSGAPSKPAVESGNRAQGNTEQPFKASSPASTGKLQLTIDEIPYPAFMVNYNFEIIWHNEMAKQDLLGNFERLPADIKERNALAYLFNGELGHSPVNRETIIQFHVTLSKGRLTRNDLLSVLPGKLGGTDDVAQRKPKFAEAYPSGSMMQLPLSLFGLDGAMIHYCVYASYYREGILFVYVQGTAGCDSLLGLLERRDEVIRNLLKKRLPVLTDVAVLVTDLQSSTRICTELPQEEYFELINQIWATMEPIFRKYYGIHGKHVGDGMVHYFFPQPDCNYIFNALVCAYKIKAAMRRISKEWQLRKNWLNELYLNTAVNEGQEWLGLFHTETKVEFTMLGDTINHTARLSDYARNGSIWATKNLLGKLSADERQSVSYGIRRKNQEGLDVLINSSYSRISELLDLTIPKHDKLCDISALPVTEILDICLEV